MVGYVTIEIILASRRHQLREAREASLLVNSALEVSPPAPGEASPSSTLEMTGKLGSGAGGTETRTGALVMLDGQ
jgi:hypothetical protein